MRSRGIAAEITAQKLREVFDAKGFAFFDGGLSYNLNIIGVRNRSREVNDFDDHILAIYRDDEGVMVVDAYQATTDPGKRYLTRPINIKGAAILCPGQYRGVYTIGMHRGKYEALCQLGRPVKVWRDNNKDEVLDHVADQVDEGWYGINVHRAHPMRELDKVEGYSAGCQVFASPTDFSEFMQNCRRSTKLYGSRLTYTLIDEEDLGFSLTGGVRV